MDNEFNLDRFQVEELQTIIPKLEDIYAVSASQDSFIQDSLRSLNLKKDKQVTVSANNESEQVEFKPFEVKFNGPKPSGYGALPLIPIGNKPDIFQSNGAESNDPTLAEQWHLINTGQLGEAGNDANVVPAWQSVTGKGVVIGIVDDGILHAHPDLKDQYRADLSFDFANNDLDPTPDTFPADYGATDDLLETVAEGLDSLSQGTNSSEVLQPLLDSINDVLDSQRPYPEALIALLTETSETLSGTLTPEQTTSALEHFQQQLQALPDPGMRYDSHGTAVAGVAAATGNNGIGVSGVAPEAELAGLKWLFSVPDVSRDDPDYDEFYDQLVANILSYKNQDIDIYNNSWGPFDDGIVAEGPGEKTLAAMAESIQKGRGGLGSIYVWAAGNGLERNDNVNFDGYANSRYTIAVSAIGANGVQSHYSEPGAAILVAGHSSSRGIGGITTTSTSTTDTPLDSPDLYTDSFGGTSSASPLVAGVVALMLEANPDLTWRDVRHILATTAVKNDATDDDWTLNGAGHHVNHKYGFGAVDAGAAVSAATTWKTVEAELSDSSEIVNIDSFVPDNQALGLTSLLTVEKNLKLESVEVVFDAKHDYRGDLEVILTSPDGTESILAQQRVRDKNDDFSQWTFSSTRHWGESSEGDWTLRVADKNGQGIGGLWNSWQLNIYGTEYKDVPNLKSVMGTDEANTLEGSEKDSLIQGLAGDDILIGLAGNDQIQGGTGDDILRGGAGRDYLWGGEGQDTLYGDDHVDMLYGGEGNDRLTGGAGNDVLTGGMGEDTLTGGKGSDRFVYNSVQAGGDIITDFHSAQDLMDVHHLWREIASEFTQGDSLSLSSIFDEFISLTSLGSDSVQVGVRMDIEDFEDVSHLATLQGVSLDSLSVSNFIV